MLYQIAINGRRDIALAPTPRAGFEMTLLRMLAFRPAQGDIAASTRPRVASSPKPTASPRVASPMQPPAAIAPVRIPETPTAAEINAAPKTEPPVAVPIAELFNIDAFNGDWSSLIKQAGLGGPAGELARNSGLIGIEDGIVRLSLKEGHGDLAAPPLVAKMQEKLSTALGQSVKVRYEKTSVVTETPADLSERERTARQQNAERSIDADSFVQAAIRDFGAHVVPGSVKPVTPAQAAEK